MSAGRNRPVIRHAGGVRALEIDLDSDDSPPPPEAEDRELVADLTEHGQRFVLARVAVAVSGIETSPTPSAKPLGLPNPAKRVRKGRFSNFG